jgi:uncharacterized protein (TIGR02594 family)
MISRRAIALGLLTYPVVLSSRQVLQGNGEIDYELTYPPFDALTDPQSLGYAEATEDQKAKARDIIGATPFGPRPIEIAESFVTRFFTTSPKLISQWPAPDAWNPLVKEFFTATSTPANNDMTPWCAAFANWCLERAGRNGSRNAGSQSFMSKYFKQVTDPQPGDLAIFTCYSNSTNKSLGIGHVAFFKDVLPGNKIRVVGGNQSQDGHSSIISDCDYVTTDLEVRRKIDGKYVSCTRRLSTYIRIT